MIEFVLLVDKLFKLEFLLKIYLHVVGLLVVVDAYPSGAWNYFKRTGLVTGWLYNTTNYCRPYSFAPCDHHTTGKYQPCGASQPTPKCERQCVAGYSGSYSND